jgi:transposase
MKEILQWLIHRPDEEEVQAAIEEANALFVMIEFMTEAPEFSNIKKLIEWAWAAQHLPLEYLQNLVARDMAGIHE